jgi:hypothetical protein
MLPSKPPDSYQTYPNKSQTQLRPPPSPPFSQKRPPPTGVNRGTFNFAAIIKGEASLIHVNLRLLSFVCLSEENEEPYNSLRGVVAASA